MKPSDERTLPNNGLLLTSTFAAQGVLRPPCSLRLLAAETGVRRVLRPVALPVHTARGFEGFPR